MNKELQAARRSFKGQKAAVPQTTFDNSPFPEGLYVLTVVESAVKSSVDKNSGAARPKHYMRLQVLEGDEKGRSAFPFGPWLDEPDGIVSSAQNVMAIKGDVVPGTQDSEGNFVISLDAFLDEAESFAASLIGEVVEARCVNRKPRADGKHLNPRTGEPWQSWYINRGLGDDAKAKKGAATDKKTVDKPASGSMAMGATKKTAKKKVPSKKKVVQKKKVVRKKK